MTRGPAASGLAALLARGREALEARIAIDARALAAFRIALGAVLLVDLLLRARSLDAFYTDAGVFPRQTLVELYPLVGRLSLHALAGGRWLQVLLFVLAGLAAVALLVGYRSRVAAASSLVLLLSLHARNPLVLNAGDSLLRQLLFWSLFVPIGARWGFDATETQFDGRRAASLATAALLSQTVVVYLVNAGVKLRGGRWLEGTAMEFVFSLDRFTILLGDALASSPWFLAVLEPLWLGMLVFSPLLIVLRGRARTVGAGTFVVAHVGMALTMALGVFPLVSIAALVPFFPPAVWSRLESWRSLVRALDRRTWAHSPPSFDLSPHTRHLLGRAGTIVVGIALALMLGYNAVTLATGDFAPSGDGGIDVGEPRWRMFAPNPPSVDGWVVVSGTLASGERIDPFRGGPVRWDRPPDLALTYPSARWRKYLTRLRHHPGRVVSRSFAASLCRQWEARGLSAIGMYFIAEPTRLEGPEPRERHLVGQFDCQTVSPT